MNTFSVCFAIFKLEIIVPSSYQSLLQGLCGNYDGRTSNDFTNPDGRPIGDVNTFGESWNIKSLKPAKIRYVILVELLNDAEV